MGTYRGNRGGVGTLGYGGYGSQNPLGLTPPDFKGLRQAATLNGLSQYLMFQNPITINANEPVHLRYIAGDTSSTQVFLNKINLENLLLIVGGVFRVNNGAATIDGLPIVSNSTSAPNDSAKHSIIYTPSSTTTLSAIGATSSNTNNSSSAFTLLKVGSGSVYNYPLDDGFANNPVIRNTADLSGATDGLAINFTAASWEVITV